MMRAWREEREVRRISAANVRGSIDALEHMYVYLSVCVRAAKRAALYLHVDDGDRRGHHRAGQPVEACDDEGRGERHVTQAKLETHRHAERRWLPHERAGRVAEEELKAGRRSGWRCECVRVVGHGPSRSASERECRQECGKECEEEWQESGWKGLKR